MPASQVPGVYHRKIGDILVTAVSDGYADFGLDIFSNASSEEVEAILRKQHRRVPPRISINAFALRYDGLTALIDCGSADIMGPTCGRLPESLAIAGINLEDVDYVLLTHVHPDHSNGLTDAATGRRLFPNAKVIVHQNEIDHWFDDEAMGKASDRVKRRYFQAGRIQLKPYLDGHVQPFTTETEVLPNIVAYPSTGHTPGHSCYIVSSRGETMIVWGDTVHSPEVQIVRPEVSMQFDTSPEQAVVSRKKVLAMAADTNMLIGGMHVHFPGFAHLRRDGENFVLTNEQWAFTL